MLGSSYVSRDMFQGNSPREGELSIPFLYYHRAAEFLTPHFSPQRHDQHDKCAFFDLASNQLLRTSEANAIDGDFCLIQLLIFERCASCVHHLSHKRTTSSSIANVTIHLALSGVPHLRSSKSLHHPRSVRHQECDVC